VGQVRPPILHLRDLRIGIVRMGPVIIRPLPLALPIDPRQIPPRVGVSMPEACASLVQKS
jgi:hypothetical protein